MPRFPGISQRRRQEAWSCERINVCFTRQAADPTIPSRLCTRSLVRNQVIFKMSTFMQSCCCKGRQPQGVVAKKRIARPEAVGLLLKDRSVPRFLVAPDGYGKTHVAFEYACIIFAFKHVAWVRCASPCFVRDLDAGVLEHEVAAADPECALVVFDELPILDGKRSDALSDVIDGLISAGREVLVACSPSADTFGMRQKDRVLVTSHELLLDSAEAAALGLADLPHADIACIAWGEGGVRRLLEGCAQEAMPADLRCAVFKLLVVGSGALDESLALFDASRRDEIAQILARYYTFLGVDAEHGSFQAIEAPLDEIKQTLLTTLEELVGCTPFANADALASDIADVLLRARRPKQAVELLRTYASAAGVVAWIDRRGWRLVMQAEPALVVSVMETAAKKARLAPVRRVMFAWALWASGRASKAQIQCQKTVLEATDPWTRASALSLMAHLKAAPLETENTLLFAESLAALEREGKVARASTGIDQLALGRLMLPVSLGTSIEADAWKTTASRALREAERGSWEQAAAVAIGAAWMMERAQGDEQGDGVLPPELAAAFASFARECAELLAFDEGAADQMAFPFLLLIQAADALDLGLDALEMLPVELMASIARIRARLDEQARERARMEEAAAQKRARFDATHPDPFRPQHVSAAFTESSVPQLEIRMFGGLDVRIDGVAVDPRSLTRRRTRTLAAALALNKGRELSRDRLCEIIWPGADADGCVNGFYSVWSSLKRALSLEGECPYLVRSQVGCSLDARYLVTDMEEFEGICTSLVFGGSHAGTWEELYAKVTGTFSSGLLPHERDNPYISEISERCKNRLVDGLLAVSRRLLASDERTGALWFTREALRRDDAREDTYIALMEAQIGANQRGPALDTYFKCRKFLSDGLGIDPSPKLVELYRSIIECEEEL